MPIFKPAGLGDWRICTSLISGFMAKESVVTSIEILFGNGVQNVITPLTAAISSIKRELGGKWAIGVVAWQCFIAWVAAFAVHGIGLLLGVM